MSVVSVPMIALAVAALGLAGCGLSEEAQAVAADAGPVESRNFAGADFNNVTAATPDRIVIRRGDAFAITARGRTGLLDRLTFRTDGSTLRIGRQDDDGISYRDQERLGTAVITITMPRLTGITLAGSGEVAAEQVDGPNAALVLAGSGDMTVNYAVVTAMDITLAGSGDITLTGRADRADVTVAGSGSITGTTFGARDAEVTVAGSGDVALSVSNRAEVSVIGSGDVAITGGATCTTSRRGSGEVTCRE
jgi:hypothetical protein